MFQRAGLISYIETWSTVVSHTSSSSQTRDLNAIISESESVFDEFVSSRESAVLLLPNGQELEVGPYFLHHFARLQKYRTGAFLTDGLVQDIPQIEYLVSEGNRKSRRWGGLVGMLSKLMHRFGLTLHQGLFVFCLLAMPVLLFAQSLMLLWSDSPPEATINWPLYFDFLKAFILPASVVLVGLASVALVHWQHRTHVSFGGVSGASVCFSASELQEFLATGVEDDNAVVSTGPKEKEFAARIVSAFDANRALVKEDMWAISKGRLTRRGFDRAWGRAREERPELGKPGRRRN